VPLGGGTPVMLALTTEFNVRDIAVDATNVYWAGYRTIGKAPVGGGAITTVATAQAGAMYIAVDATNIYWVNTDIDAGAIMKLAK
jgi:hypothetical protein